MPSPMLMFSFNDVLGTFMLLFGALILGAVLCHRTMGRRLIHAARQRLEQDRLETLKLILAHHALAALAISLAMLVCFAYLMGITSPLHEPWTWRSEWSGLIGLLAAIVGANELLSLQLEHQIRDETLF